VEHQRNFTFLILYQNSPITTEKKLHKRYFPYH